MSKIKLILYVSTAILLGILSTILLKPSEEGQPQNTINDADDYPYELPQWIEIMEQDEEIPIAEARRIFDNYWEDHSHYRGDNSKRFERWYEINSRRLDTRGNVIPASQVISELQKLRTLSTKGQYGDWFNYGPINVGPRNGVKKDGGRVKDIDFHPSDDSTFYVSTFKGGLFKTNDYGASWQALTDQLAEEVYVSEISASNPDSIFTGTNLGIYVSANGGETWTKDSPFSEKTKALLIAGTDPVTIIAGTESGIWLKKPGLSSWEKVQDAAKVEDLDQHPENDNIIYASTNGSPSQFFRSTDGGQTWTENTGFGRGCFMVTAVTPASPDRVYLLNSRDHLDQDSFEGFYVSEDSGETFEKVSGYFPCITGYKNTGDLSRGQPNYNLFVCADPVNPDLVYAGGVKSWKSIDGGHTWSHFFEDITSDNGSLHLDQLNWAWSPHDSTVFAVNDGGVYYLDKNNVFNMITDGLPIAEIYECSQSQTRKTNVAGGTMHCGVKINNNGIWYTPWGGDEATCLIDPTNEKLVYHIKYEKISRSDNAGMSFSNIYPSNTDRGYYTGTGLLQRDNPEKLFVGLTEIHVANNARAENVEWKTISSFGGTQKIQKIEQAASDTDIMYVARGSAFFRSSNINSAYPSFEDITSMLPFAGQVSDIATDPSSPADVYILIGSKIFKSDDKGNSWEDISINLPSVGLLEMIFDNSSDKGIYIGTDIGVFYKDNTLDEWIDYSNKLPAIRVSGMDIYYGSSRQESFITISTDGRGFWRSPLYGVQIDKPIADFTSDKNEIIQGGKVKFSPSDNLLTNYYWTFEGGEPGNSINEEPEVNYNLPGSYKVTLTASNTAGHDSITKYGYISVLEKADGGPLELNIDFDNHIDDASAYSRDCEVIGNIEAGNDSTGYFDGSSNILIPGYKGITASSDRSILAWIKSNSPGKSVISWGTATTSKKYNIRTDTQGQLRVEVGGGYIISTANICDNKWHHIAVTFADDGTPDVSDTRMYIDGRQAETGSLVPVSIETAAGDDVEIGNDQLNRKFNGWMDDIKVYSKELTLSEILDIKGEKILSDKKDIIEDKILLYGTDEGIVIGNQGTRATSLSVYNYKGQKIMAGNYNPGQTLIPLDNGIYIISYLTNNIQKHKKLIVR